MAAKIHLVLSKTAVAVISAFSSLLCCCFSDNTPVFVSAGVKKGDRVSIYMPMVVELVVAMLACVRIGAVHSIVVSYIHGLIRRMCCSIYMVTYG